MRHIKIIKRFYRKCLRLFHSFPLFTINKLSFSYYSINSFIVSCKKNNDANNKIRENIIIAIINNKVPCIYFKYSNRWKKLKNNLFKYINSIDNINDFNDVKIVHRGGRKYNYDFTLIINNKPYNIEFKFNSKCIEDTPQFNSPMKPSQYMSSCYEEYYYDNYLYQLASYANLIIPDKSSYLKDVHSTKPKCLIDFQNLYDKGNKECSRYTGEYQAIEFHNLSKILCNESIEEFIKNTELNLSKLTEYLTNSQKNKIYMNYKNGIFYNENVNMDDYILISYTKQKNYYKAVSKSGKNIKILLRWKNGNGIAFPAFQISIK